MILKIMVIYNSNYNFMETVIATKYTELSYNGKDRPFVTMFNRNGKKLDQISNSIIFRKMQNEK